MRTGILILLSLFCAAYLLPSYAYSQTTPGCPNDDIAHYWKFDETSEPATGTATFSDFIDAGVDATCTVGVDCPAITTGIINNALLFNETVDETDGLNVAPDSSFDWSSSTSFSIEFWMKTPSSSTCEGNQVIVGRDDSGNGLHWWVGCNGTGGTADFTLDNSSGGTFVKGTTDITDGAWHHIVAVRDANANELRIYVDGVKEGQASQSYLAGFASTQPLNIGWLNEDPYYRFSGTIDEVALYNGVLSENEIRQHYYDGTVGLARGYCGCASVVDVMPMGDSITHGFIYTDPPLTDAYMIGYRSTLWHDLIDAGYDIHFVGSQSSGASADPDFDPQHEGHGGYLTGDVATDVDTWLGLNPPNVVLLHIGSNDYTNPSSPTPGSVNNVQTILDDIHLYGPVSDSPIVVLLARIINQETPAPEITAFNDDVVSMAQNLIANGYKIIIVDQEHALTYPDDMSDALHPNTSGYDKMAQAWMNSLVTFLPLCGQSPPTINSNPVTQAYVGLPYTYNVDSIGFPAPTYSITTTPPTGMLIDPDTGLVTWTPASTGSFPVTVQADNGLTPPDTQSFTIEVNNTPQCPSDLAHYWTLDETLGPPYTDFFGAATGTCGAACPIATAGKIGGAQLFNGTDEVSVADDNSFDWGSSDSFSIEFWMKTPGSSTCDGNQVVVGRNDSSTGLQWWVGCSGSGGMADFNLYDTSGSGTFVKGVTDLTDGQWHHVVAVRDGVANKIDIYVDGVKEGSADGTYSYGFGSDRPLNIGWLSQSPYYRFDGTVDDVAIYNRALSDTEIMQHFHDGEASYGYCIMDGTTTYTVTPSLTGSGSMTPSTAQDIRDGSTTTFTVTPDTGYHIVSVTGCGGALSGSAYTTGSITANCIVTANFTIDQYDIVAHTDGNGTISCLPNPVDYGGSVQCTLSPASGYRLASLTDNSSDVTALVSNDTYSLSGVTADHNIYATFADNLYVRRVSGSTDYYYSSIQSAYDPATILNDDIIQSEAMSLDEDLTFDLDVQITLEGGYDQAFQDNQGYTTVHSLTVSNGTVIVENLVLE